MVKYGRRVVPVISVAGFLALCFAQQPSTIRVKVDVVNVLATVRDRDGKIVTDLTKDDFILEEDGKKQKIEYFSRNTDLPLTIGLLIDTSKSQDNLIREEKTASSQFLEQILRPDEDRAFVITFNSEAELIQDLTNSRERLQKALNSIFDPKPSIMPILKWRSFEWKVLPLEQNLQGGIQFPGGRFPGGGYPGGGNPGGGRQGGGRPGSQRPAPGFGTAVYDSVFLASDEIMKRQKGRKALILISDGIDNCSIVQKKTAIDAAQIADTLIYGIRYYDSSAYQGLAKINVFLEGNALSDFSEETGGRVFDISKKLPLKEIYDIIQEELRSQYSLGYTPSAGDKEGFRRIKLSTKNKKLKVATRSGYFFKRS